MKEDDIALPGWESLHSEHGLVLSPVTTDIRMANLPAMLDTAGESSQAAHTGPRARPDPLTPPPASPIPPSGEDRGAAIFHPAGTFG